MEHVIQRIKTTSVYHRPSRKTIVKYLDIIQIVVSSFILMMAILSTL